MMKHALQVLYRLEAGVTVVAYIATTLSLLADVLGREILGQGVWGAPRFAVYAAIIAGFLGMSLAAADGRHVRPQFLDFLIPPPFDPYMNRLADILSAFLYGSLGVLAWGFVSVSLENGDTAPVLDWTLWPIQLVLPYTFFSVSFRYLMNAAWPASQAIHKMKEGDVH